MIQNIAGSNMMCIVSIKAATLTHRPGHVRPGRSHTCTLIEHLYNARGRWQWGKWRGRGGGGELEGEGGWRQKVEGKVEEEGGGGRWRGKVEGKVEGEGGGGWVGKVEWGKGGGGRKGGEGMGIGHAN